MLGRVGGREHDVFYDPATDRWLKFTKPARAGYVVELVDGKLQMFPATPLQFLRRWRFTNRLFADDVELIGLVDGREPRIGISQRDLSGEAPSWEELHQAMTEVYELRQLRTNASLGAYEARAYARSRFAIFDVQPANCMRSPEGEVVPFDVIPLALDREGDAVLRNFFQWH